MNEPVVIVPSPDGPYLVRGPFELRTHLGRRVELTRTPSALGRCGRSQTQPFQSSLLQDHELSHSF